MDTYLKIKVKGLKLWTRPTVHTVIHTLVLYHLSHLLGVSFVLLFALQQGLEVYESPGMPSLVPLFVVFGSLVVVLENGSDSSRGNSGGNSHVKFGTPVTKLQVASEQQDKNIQ